MATTSAFPVVPSIVETRKYPVIVRWWESVWEEFTPFFRFGTEIRHIVCTINAIESRRFLRAHYAPGEAPGDWEFGVYTDVRDLRESVVLFGNHREVWFQVNRGPVAGRANSTPRNRHRLVAGRLHGNQFGAGMQLHAGSVAFPDRHDVVDGTSAEARAYRRYVARLHNPLPLRVGRPVRPGFDMRTRRRSAG
ncbi:transposase [Streptomyces sp. NPDC015144]|uniref:transposase n=1 Tax=Streptomyces sp. NPDC015144 TaxID=3364944 RepID=UPI0036FFB231